MSSSAFLSFWYSLFLSIFAWSKSMIPLIPTKSVFCSCKFSLTDSILSLFWSSKYSKALTMFMFWKAMMDSWMIPKLKSSTFRSAPCWILLGIDFSKILMSTWSFMDHSFFTLICLFWTTLLETMFLIFKVNFEMKVSTICSWKSGISKSDMSISSLLSIFAFSFKFYMNASLIFIPMFLVFTSLIFLLAAGFDGLFWSTCSSFFFYTVIDFC
mmetsp:Transcript_23319/g.22943  ORF Transcript_23319/g.22943 Transcript_23319/m.22943 type:complete len:213 (-) Transcript_23319:910-1548(-)